MKGRPGEQRRWLESRFDCYQGSAMHFLRSVFEGDSVLGRQGFQVFRMIRRANPARPADTLIRARIRKYTPESKLHPEWRDSGRYWLGKLKLPKAVDMLVKKPLAIADFAHATNTKEILDLYCTDYLYVTIHKKIDEKYHSNMIIVAHPDITIIAFKNKSALFYRNGILLDPSAIVFDGLWGLSGVADMLPVDYAPEISQKIR